MSHTRSERPPTVWARCADPKQISHLNALIARLREDGDDVQLLLTLPWRDPSMSARDHPTGAGEARDFLRRLNPIMVLWVGGTLDLTTISECVSAEIPVAVLNGESLMLRGMRGAWVPGRLRNTLLRLHAVLAIDAPAAKAFTRAGANPSDVHITGRIDESGQVLPYFEAERQDLATVIGTRPIWLAARINLAEAEWVAKAHRQASRRAHRLLLIAAPEHPEYGPALAEIFRDHGCNAVLRSKGAEPGEATQVYVADTTDELGLWYRLAPISYCGGSLSGGARDDPFHAVALGSVVIHGPHAGDFTPQFSRLLSAKATCQIQQPIELGAAIIQLLSADKAAQFAAAGWDVTSSGADVTNRLIAMIQDRLDRPVA